MQVTGKVTVQFTRPAILHIALHMILPAISLVISDITCPVVRYIIREGTERERARGIEWPLPESRARLGPGESTAKDAKIAKAQTEGF